MIHFLNAFQDELFRFPLPYQGRGWKKWFKPGYPDTPVSVRIEILCSSSREEVRMVNATRFRILALMLCALLLTAAHHSSSTEALMFEAAEVFVTSLNRVQKSYTQFDFDAKHRMDWHYFPEGGFTRT